MTNVVDRDQQWLLNCLNATLNSNFEVRSFAEVSLHQASLQPGFGAALSKVASNRELPFGLRQLAAVLLKQFVKKHWQEDDEMFEHPVVSREEKEIIRECLLLSLDESHRKICTAISVAVGTIAQYDWPEDWPDLLPFLLKLITEQSNMCGVFGAMRCLTLITADVDDTIVPRLIPSLFPSLYRIVSSPQIYDKYIRAKALAIVYSCTSMLGVMSGAYKAETSALLLPMLKLWIDQFSKILDYPVQPEDPYDWAIRIEVLKSLNKFVQDFSSLSETQFMVIVGPLWQTFISSLRVYEMSAINGTEDSLCGQYDSDGAEKSFETFIIQMFEFLVTVVGNAKFAMVFANNLKDLVYHILSFLQMTEQQFQTWSLDANEYVADEDDNACSCRVSGTLLLEVVASSFGINGIDAILDAAEKQFIESQQAKAVGSATWWRIREATIFSLASVSEQLLEIEVSGPRRSRLGSLVEQIITEDIGVEHCPFLHARVFSSISKFSSVISHDALKLFLYAAIKSIDMDVPPPVKVGACRALSQLLPEVNREIVQPHILNLFSSLTSLLNQSSDETLHLVLETLQSVVKAGHEDVKSVEPIISPIILNMWALHVSDPFISIDAIEVLETIKRSPGCVHQLVSHILPYIGPILGKPKHQPEGLVAGSLDLLTMLLKNAPNDVVKAVFDVCFYPVIQIVLQSDDHSEMQNGTECLAVFISGGKTDILVWGGDAGFTMRCLLDATSRLLDPDLESSGSLFVGSFIMQLILHLPLQMAEHIRDLVAALVRRLQSSQISGLRNSLFLVFARLVHMCTPRVEQFVDLLLSVPAKGHINSFAYVLSEWTKQQGEIQGAYQIKVTTTALALLLASRHDEMGKISVQGYLIKKNAGIMTRSKAKITPDQWTMMPLPPKILALLADVMIEINEQIVDYADEDSEGNDEADNELKCSSNATSFRGPSNEQLEAVANVFNENQENGSDDDMLCVEDPLIKINLANYLVDFLVKFSQADKHFFDYLCQSLSDAQRNVIYVAINQH